MNKFDFEEEIHIRILRILQEESELSQRDLARRLGISLGKTNYCLTAIVKKGLVQIKRFKNSQKKIAYAYLLTPSGVEEKVLLTTRFLSQKMNEYEALKNEIAQLEREINLEMVHLTTE